MKGLVLSGGGARGAWQAGALLRLAELGWRWEVIAGASIGALNGAWVAQGDGSPQHLKGLVELWRALPAAGILEPDLGTVGALLHDPLATASELALGTRGLLTDSALRAFLEPRIDVEHLARGNPRLLVTLTPATIPLIDLVGSYGRQPTTIDVSTIPPAHALDVLMASAAIPLLWPAREVGDHRFVDGALSDAVPARAVAAAGARRLVCLQLSDRWPLLRSSLPRDVILHSLRPTVGLDDPSTMTLDFSRQNIEDLLRLGYHDADAAMAKVAVLEGELRELVKRGEALEKRIEAMPFAGHRPSPPRTPNRE